MTDSIQLAVSTVVFALRADDAFGESARPARSLQLPLVRRIREPFEGCWALPGGPLTPDHSLADAANATLRSTTNLSPRYLEQLYTFGGVDRSPAAADAPRVVSVVYWALIGDAESQRTTLGQNVRWFPADRLPALAFDHTEIVRYAVERLRNKVAYSQLAHAFLDDAFTLTQLREVYEAVLGRRLDPANFRRQVEASGLIVPTGETIAGTRHRPPRLYRYNSPLSTRGRGMSDGTTSNERRA